jgi:hypothetical protein
MNINYKDLLRQYFQYFSAKDSTSLAKMFANEIVLMDWNIRSEGKDNVLIEVMKIFAAYETIDITLISFFKGLNDTFAAQVTISLDGKEAIHVIDTFEFDYNGKIHMINAFKYIDLL